MQKPAATPETVSVLLPLPLADAYDYLPGASQSSSPLEGEAGWGVGSEKTAGSSSGEHPPTNSLLKGGRTSSTFTETMFPPGTVVEVPFGARKMTGVVWGPGSGGVPAGKLKSIAGPAGLPPVPEVSRAFVDWVAQYTVTPPGAVLKMLFGSMRVIQPKKKDDYSTPLPDPDHHQPELTDDQRKAAAVLVAKLRTPSPLPITQ